MSEPETLSLNRSDLHQAILQAWQSSLTGVQEFRGEGSERSLYWHEGKLVFASSRDEGDRLQEILMARGHFTREQFNELAPHFQTGQSIGRNLVDSGLITQKDLVQGARSQVQQIFNGCFAYASATLTLRPGEEHLPTLRIPLELPAAIVPAVLALEDRSWLADEAQGFFHRRLMLLPRAEQAVLDQLSFGAAVLPLLDGSRDFAQIGFECDVEEFRLLKLLYLLQLLGWLEVGEPEPDQATVRQELADVLVEPLPTTQPAALAETAALPKLMPAQADPTLHLPRLPEARPGATSASRGEPDLPGMPAEFSLPAAPRPEASLSEAGLPEASLPEAARSELPLLGIEDQRPLFARPWFLALLLVALAAPVLWLTYRPQAPLDRNNSAREDLENSHALFPEPDAPAGEEDPGSAATAPEQLPDQAEPAQEEAPSGTEPAPDSTAEHLEGEAGPAPAEQSIAEPPPSPVAETLPPYVRQPQVTAERPVRRMEPPSSQSGEGAAQRASTRPKDPAAGQTPAPESAAAASQGNPSEQESTENAPLPAADEVAPQEQAAEPGFASAELAWQAASFAAAAQLWVRELAGQPSTTWVVALELACQESSVRLAAQLVPKPERMFLLPRNLLGKPCYWVCYGRYEQEDEARQALAELDFYRKSNANPPMLRRLGELLP